MKTSRFLLISSPIKRLDIIAENELEKFPPEISHDQKRLELIRRIDFAWAVEKDTKKQKTSSKETSNNKPWPWQTMMENLHSAHQELSVIIDLIHTVEANDAVTVAGMTRPKPLPNEVLSDLSISTATKLQCFRHLGKYFKQSAKGLEHQIAKESRFYGALIRLQKNWKIKRQRTTISTPSNEGFTIDLCDNSFSDPMAVYRSPSISSIKVDHDSAGMLSVNLPPKSCRSIQFGFVGDHSGYKPIKVSKKESGRDEDVDASAKETHSILREVHRAIFDEQVFDLVNREAVSPSVAVNVTGIRENYLELGIGQGASVYLSLEPLGQYVDEFADEQNWENVTSDGSDTLNKLSAFPSSVSFEIYLQQIFHENILVRTKDKHPLAGKSQTVKGFDLLGHFCLTLAHRIFSNKVLAQLENLASKISYLHLLSRPTWHSRTSSWSLLMKVPPSVLDAGNRVRPLNIHSQKNGVKSQFETRVVVIDDCVNIEGEGAPNVVSLFKGGSEEMGSLNSYDYDLADLPVIILQQVASQVVGWLHEEALMVGMKASRDFLSLSFELEQGDRLSLVAHVDPRDTQGCISWYLVMADGFMEETKLGKEESEKMKYLGFLSLETLYSLLMDLLSLCNRDANH
ncbi:hypothetical protein ACHQM5_002478 [Ranunculus cassubicifolius]